MPLLVHCPNSCQIRVPANRTGKVVRCAECQTPIRIPALDSPLLRTGNLVECRAKRAIKKSGADDDVSSDLSNQAASPPTTPQPKPSGPAVVPDSSSLPNGDLVMKPSRQTARLLRAKPWRMVKPLTRVDPEASLPPINLEAKQTATSPAEDHENSKPILDNEQEEIGNLPMRRPSWFLRVQKLLRL